METRSIYYYLTFPDQSQTLFLLEIDPDRMELINNIPDPLPAWTDLTFHQCPHCPLDRSRQPYCPLAANQVNIIKQIGPFLPYHKVLMEVVTDERKITQTATLQAAFGSLMGLVMPLSGCPHTAYFKPMARFHVPLANASETMYRSVAMYFMAQYFLHKEGKSVDLNLTGLSRIYENIHVVNTSIAERFLAASTQDSSVDALVQLDIYAMTFLGILEEPLQELRPLFSAYFEEYAPVSSR